MQPQQLSSAQRHRGEITLWFSLLKSSSFSFCYFKNKCFSYLQPGTNGTVGPGLLLACVCACFCRWCEASVSPGVSKDGWIFFCLHFPPHLPRGINIILPNLFQTRSSFPYSEQFSQSLCLYQIWRCSLTALSPRPSLRFLFFFFLEVAEKNLVLLLCYLTLRVSCGLPSFLPSLYYRNYFFPSFSPSLFCLWGFILSHLLWRRVGGSFIFAFLWEIDCMSCRCWATDWQHLCPIDSTICF